MPEPVGATTKKYNAVVVVTSDTCYKDPSQDESGPYVVEQLNDTNLFAQVHKFIVSDDMDSIVECLEKSLNTHDPALIITVGGTGMCPRDVTPEATSSLYEKQCSGIVTSLHMSSLRYVPHAALSRLTAGIVGGTLIVNFPGKLKACRDCIQCLAIILEHALEQVRYDFDAYTATHKRQEQQRQQKAKVQKQVLRSPTGKCIELSVSSSSLSSMNNGHNHAIPSKNRPSPNQHTPRSRSSSEVSKHKLSIKAIQESRDELSSFEQDHSDAPNAMEPRQPKIATTPKPFQTKAGKQFMKPLPKGTLTQPFKQPQQQPQPKPAQPKPAQPKLAQPKPAQLALQPVPLPQVKILQNNSIYPLIPYNKSLEILTSQSKNLFDELVEVDLNNFSRAFSCIGSTLAEDLTPKRIVPPYAVSTMDGYVLNVHSSMKKAINQVKKLLADIVPSLQEYEKRQLTDKGDNFFCYQVNTGGRLPKFNYAVIPAEKANRTADDRVTIEEVKQGLYVRSAGCDIGHQDVIKSGTVIGPVELSSIIAMGHRKFKIVPRPRLGVLSTGDEIEDFFANEFINQNSVVDMNGPLLQSMFRLLGYHVFSGGVAKDDPSDLYHKMTQTLKKCEVLMITGGASMGTKDHVKDVIQHMGGTIHFGRVDIKPGKPVAFASLLVDDKRKFIFSLPGNPVSAFVTALVLVLPFLKHGAESYLQIPRQITEHIGEKIWAQIQSLVDIKEGQDPYRFDGRLEFVRAKILSKKMEFSQGSPNSMYLVQVSVKQHSSRLLNLVDCDCLIMIDPSKRGQHLTEGFIYPAIKLNRKS